MGRKNLKKLAAAQPTPVAAAKVPAGSVRPESLRRLLLGVATALIVARPFVLGEDPGLLNQLSGAAGLMLSMTWLLVAVGTAVWRLWSGEPMPRIHPVEWGLAALTALAFLTAEIAAHFHFSARLIAWEWLIFLLVFALVRRLARAPAERGHLLAALLATGVSLSIYALYQVTVELPQMRATLETEEALSQEVAKYNVYLPVGDPRLTGWKDRLQQNNVFATYAHPNSFAGFLALVMPGTVGWALVCWRRERRWSWRVGISAAAAALVVTALLLTHSRGAIIGSCLAALLLGPFIGIPLAGKRRGLLLGAGIIVLLALGLIALTPAGSAGLQRARESLGLRGDYWTATAAMIRDHVWWGIGWGNFGRVYPHYMIPTAYEKIQDPHNFFLEVWASSGLLAAVVLIAALIAFYVFWVRQVRQSQPEDELARPRYAGNSTGAEPPAWCLPSCCGRATLDQGRSWVKGVLSVGRAAVWFIVFVTLTSLPSVGRTLTLAMGIGVTALLCNLLISGGIAQPSVAQPLWIVAALSLPVTATIRFRPLFAVAGLACSVLLTVVFGFLVYEPLWRVDALLADARRHYGDGGSTGWRTQIKARWQKALQSQNPRLVEQSFGESNQYLNRFILKPLEQALSLTPDDAKLAIELAQWYEEQWNLFPENDDLGRKAVDMARRAQRSDRDSRDAYVLESSLQLRRAERTPKKAQECRQEALRALHKAVECDPTEATLHFELAELYFTLQDDAAGKREAARALELNDLSTTFGRKLADPQVEKTLRQRLKASAAQ